MTMVRTLAFIVVLLRLMCPVSSEAFTNYPASLDTNTTLYNVSTGDVYIADYHNNPKDAILALEAKVGVNSSSVITSLDYLVTNAASENPGHKHTTTSVSFLDGSVGAPGLLFGNPVTDTTTGVFHPSVGVLGFSSAGVETFRYSGTGIGIFATTPYFPLDVTGIVRLRGASSLCFGGTGAADNDTCAARSAAHVLSLSGSLVLTDQATGDNTLVLRGIAAKTGEFLRIFLNTTDANPILQVTETGVIEAGAGGASAVDTNLYRASAGVWRTGNALIVDGLVTASGGVSIGDATDVVLGTVTGTKFGTAVGQKLGFYNATPVVQQANTVDIKDLQISMGFRAAGVSASPLDLDGGTLTAGDVIAESQFQYDSPGTIALVAGQNHNIAIGLTATIYRITGPAGAYSITGIAGPSAGRMIILRSTVLQTLTIENEDAGSTAAYRITTLTGADIVCTVSEEASVTLVYDASTSRWIVMAVNNCPTV